MQVVEVRSTGKVDRIASQNLSPWPFGADHRAEMMMFHKSPMVASTFVYTNAGP